MKHILCNTSFCLHKKKKIQVRFCIFCSQGRSNFTTERDLLNIIRLPSYTKSSPVLTLHTRKLTHTYRLHTAFTHRSSRCFFILLHLRFHFFLWLCYGDVLQVFPSTVIYTNINCFVCAAF